MSFVTVSRSIIDLPYNLPEHASKLLYNGFEQAGNVAVPVLCMQNTSPLCCSDKKVIYSTLQPVSWTSNIRVAAAKNVIIRLLK